MRGWGFAAALIVAGCAAEGPVPIAAPSPPSSTPPVPPGATRRATATESPRRDWLPARVIADAPPLPERVSAALAGDTLASLAARAGTSPGALAVANHLTPPFTLAPGQRLTVPAGRWHAVKPGETGIAIARAYRAQWRRVILANGLKPPYALEVGDKLLIPAPQPSRPVPATVEGRAHAFNLDIDALLGAEHHPRATLRPVSPPPLRGPLPHSGEDLGSSPEWVGGPPVQRMEGSAPAPPVAVPAIHLEWPLTGRVLSAFGPKPGGRFNDGINIAAVAGAPVHAAADGVVAYAGNGVAAFGGLILLRHAGGWLTAYAHCEALLVAKGDSVGAGQIIARAGATGEVDEPQLHFEVRRGRVPVDPGRVLEHP